MSGDAGATQIWPDRIIAQLDDADRRAHALANGLTIEQLNWRPSPDEWSIGQCLQHLLVFNQLYIAAISRALDGQPPSTVKEVEAGRISAWFMRTYVEAGSNSRRVPSPRKIKPSQEGKQGLHRRPSSHSHLG